MTHRRNLLVNDKCVEGWYGFRRELMSEAKLTDDMLQGIASNSRAYLLTKATRQVLACSARSCLA